MSEGLVIENNLYLKGPEKKIIKRITTEQVSILTVVLSGLILAINKDIAMLTNAANKAIQPPLLSVVIMPIPQRIRDAAASIFSFLLSEKIIRATVIIKSAERKAANILGSVIIPQHLVLKSSFDAGSNQVLGIGGASMYSQIAIIP